MSTKINIETPVQKQEQIYPSNLLYGEVLSVLSGGEGNGINPGDLLMKTYRDDIVNLKNGKTWIKSYYLPVVGVKVKELNITYTV